MIMSDADSISADLDLGRPVRIRWIDSGLSVTEWSDRHELPKDVSRVESVGLWIGENDHVVYIAGTRDVENEHWLNCQIIWKRAIIEQEWLV